MISLYGQPYDPTTLKTVPPSEEAVMNRVSKSLSTAAQDCVGFISSFFPVLVMAIC